MSRTQLSNHLIIALPPIDFSFQPAFDIMAKTTVEYYRPLPTTSGFYAHGPNFTCARCGFSSGSVTPHRCLINCSRCTYNCGEDSDMETHVRLVHPDAVTGNRPILIRVPNLDPAQLSTTCTPVPPRAPSTARPSGLHVGRPSAIGTDSNPRVAGAAPPRPDIPSRPPLEPTPALNLSMPTQGLPTLEVTIPRSSEDLRLVAALEAAFCRATQDYGGDVLHTPQPSSPETLVNPGTGPVQTPYPLGSPTVRDIPLLTGTPRVRDPIPVPLTSLVLPPPHMASTVPVMTAVPLSPAACTLGPPILCPGDADGSSSLDLLTSVYTTYYTLKESQDGVDATLTLCDGNTYWNVNVLRATLLTADSNWDRCSTYFRSTMAHIRQLNEPISRSTSFTTVSDLLDLARRRQSDLMHRLRMLLDRIEATVSWPGIPPPAPMPSPVSGI